MSYHTQYILAQKTKGSFRFEPVWTGSSYNHWLSQTQNWTIGSVLPWTRTLDWTLVRFWWVQVWTTVLNQMLPQLSFSRWSDIGTSLQLLEPKHGLFSNFFSCRLLQPFEERMAVAMAFLPIWKFWTSRNSSEIASRHNQIVLHDCYNTRGRVFLLLIVSVIHILRSCVIRIT